MSAPITRPCRAPAASLAVTACRPSRWRDGARRVLLQPLARLRAAVRAWRQRGRDHAALQELGARELRDIGLVRHAGMTVGERALGNL